MIFLVPVPPPQNADRYENGINRYVQWKNANLTIIEIQSNVLMPEQLHISLTFYSIMRIKIKM